MRKVIYILLFIVFILGNNQQILSQVNCYDSEISFIYNDHEYSGDETVRKKPVVINLTEERHEFEIQLNVHFSYESCLKDLVFFTSKFKENFEEADKNNDWIKVEEVKQGDRTSIIYLRVTVEKNIYPKERDSDRIIQVLSYQTEKRHAFFRFQIRQSKHPTSQYYYPDQDGDGLGDHFSGRTFGLKPIPGYVTNNKDYCPHIYSKSEDGCEDLLSDTYRNSVKTKSYDIKGSLVGSSKEYYNSLGKLEQTQIYDVKYNKIWAKDLLYDKEGRLALSSMSAPIANSFTGSFGFKKGFIKRSDGSLFDESDYDGSSALSPSEVGDEINTLGWYYSVKNSKEPLQDITKRPYSRTLYSKLYPGGVKQVIGGNKQLGKWRQGYSFSMKSSQELYYAFGYDYFPKGYDLRSELNSGFDYAGKRIVSLQSTKTVSQDVHGNEFVSFTDSSGKLLGSARSGGSRQYDVLSLIGEEGYVDIHIPEGCGNTAKLLGSTNNYKIYDLKTEELVSHENLSRPGFYRVWYIGGRELSRLDGVTYIDLSSGQIKPIKEDIGVFGVRYKVNYYDYSLNYYDKGGKLISALPILGFNTSCLSKLSGTVNHKEELKTFFKYNSLGELLSIESPDEGRSFFKYRKDGQIRFSQNENQEKLGEFSYINYDTYGRPIESGVCKGLFSDYSGDIGNGFSGKRKDQHFTEYDYLSSSGINTLSVLKERYKKPTFLSGNVSRSYKKEGGIITSETYYSYDIYGRVKWLVQNILGLGKKTIDYKYDAVTGQLNELIYQEGQPDEFRHRYSYDPDTYALVKVETKTISTPYTEDASYSYYETGSLKRLVLSRGIQDIDYVYTLGGQLKSINHPSLSKDKELNPLGSDLFGVTLDYYSGDYRRSSKFNYSGLGNEQYNGNIKSITWNTKGNGEPTPVKYSYVYDKNNWLKEARFSDAGIVKSIDSELFIAEKVYLNKPIKASREVLALEEITLGAGFTVKSGSGLTFTARIEKGGEEKANSFGDDYRVSISGYDSNGNIQGLLRNKNKERGSNAMDALTYHYKKDKPNQLDYVSDGVTEDTQASDIKGQSPGNYKYNELGQLVSNAKEDVSYEYTTSGLVSLVKYKGSPKVRFYYDDKGFRLKKVSYQGGKESVTHYIRDALGKVMAIYENGKLVELPIYGLSRLGIYNKLSNTSVYQLTDHLGNVRAVVSRKKLPKPLNYSEIVYSDDLENSLGWNSRDSSHGVSAALVEDKVHSGSHSIKIAGEGVSNKNPYAHSDKWISIDNKEATDYVFSGWMYLESPDYGWGRLSLHMKKEGETSYFTEVSSSEKIKTKDKWVYVSHKVRVPSHIKKLNLRVGLYSESTRGNVWFDDLEVRRLVTVTEAAVLSSATDYYPFGMPMPNRQIVNGKPYRYAYQGQEKDPETGKEAFQLRLWDGRIGRWLTTDPKGEFASPYLGMGNNPIRLTDPDGGHTEDEWNVDAKGNLTWISDKGGDQIQYFNFKDGHEFEGQTAVALGNFDKGLNFVDMLSTSSIGGGIFSQFEDSSFGNESIIQFYTDRGSYNGNSELVYHPITGQQVYGNSGALKENNIIFDVLTLGSTFKGLYNIFRGVPKDKVLGGASRTVGYFTDKAAKAGYSTALTGARVKAGVFVQMHHNVGRLLKGRGIKMLYSNSAASSAGRGMLNNAYKTTSIQFLIGGGSTYNDFRN